MLFKNKKLRDDQINLLTQRTQRVSSKLQSENLPTDDTRYDLARMRLLLQHYEFQLSAHRLMQAVERLINNILITVISLLTGLISGAIGLPRLLALLAYRKIVITQRIDKLRAG